VATAGSCSWRDKNAEGEKRKILPWKMQPVSVMGVFGRGMLVLACSSTRGRMLIRSHMALFLTLSFLAAAWLLLNCRRLAITA